MDHAEYSVIDMKSAAPTPSQIGQWD